MGNTQALIEVVKTAREELTNAQKVADNTKRPDNVCQAHDCQFALTKALTHGIDTLLMLKLEEMRVETGSSANVSPFRVSGGSASFVATIVAVSSGLRPVAWPLAVICFSPNAVEIFRIVVEVFSKQ
jgi:hypothetical protein